MAAVERAISATGHVIVNMADFPPRISLRRSCAPSGCGGARCMWVLGTRYGSPVRDKPEVSYPELEFATATEAGLDRLVLGGRQDAPGGGLCPGQAGRMYSLAGLVCRDVPPSVGRAG